LLSVPPAPPRAPAGSPRSTTSAATALALTVTVLLLEPPGRALAQGAARGGDNVLKRSKPTTPADLDRSILLEWREGSPQLQEVWNDTNAPMYVWEGVTVGAEGRVVTIHLPSEDLQANWWLLLRGQYHGSFLTGSVPAALGQGLTLVHFSAQPEPFLSLKLYETTQCVREECSRQAEKWKSVSPCAWATDRAHLFGPQL